MLNTRVLVGVLEYREYFTILPTSLEVLSKSIHFETSKTRVSGYTTRVLTILHVIFERTRVSMEVLALKVFKYFQC